MRWNPVAPLLVLARERAAAWMRRRQAADLRLLPHVAAAAGLRAPVRAVPGADVAPLARRAARLSAPRGITPHAGRKRREARGAVARRLGSGRVAGAAAVSRWRLAASGGLEG